MKAKIDPRKTAQRLISSKTRWDLLELLFTNPDGWFFMRELARATNQELNAVRRETSVMTKEGLILMKPEQRKTYFKVNPNHPLYSELSALIYKVRKEDESIQQ